MLQVKQSELFDNINVRIPEAVNYYENCEPLVLLGYEQTLTIVYCS